jgi:hypothetical protein
MGFLSRIFGFQRAPERPPNSRPHSQEHSQLASGYSQQHSSNPQSTNSTRRELLRVVLRDTLNRHGIPAAWVGAEMLLATSRTRESGIHWRLVVKHWDPRLMTHAVAFQQSLIRRVMTFDPMAATWLMGISWQFALPDESVCPAMPHPGTWTSDPYDRQTEPSPLQPGGAGDVIEGPVRIADELDPAAQTRADLERLMALREADFRKHSGGGEGEGDPDAKQFPATEPAKLS